MITIAHCARTSHLVMGISCLPQAASFRFVAHGTPSYDGLVMVVLAAKMFEMLPGHIDIDVIAREPRMQATAGIPVHGPEVCNDRADQLP
jgi:hypothetical protein